MLTSHVSPTSCETTSNETIDVIFNALENEILDRKELTLEFKNILFISTYFLERLEKLIQRAKDLNVKVQIVNVQPAIYKVFQIARVKDILAVCTG